MLLNTRKRNQLRLSANRPSNNWALELKLSNGDGNDNDNRAIGLDWQSKILHVLHAFLYISLPSPYDYDVKLPIFMFFGGR